MKTIIFFFFFSISYSVFSQNNQKITGDWILPQLAGESIPFQIIKLEQFSEENYVGSLESPLYPLSLYKIRKFNIRRKLFFDAVWLKEDQENNHHYWFIQKVSKDSAKVCLLNSFPIDLGNKDIIDSKGQVLMIDTTKIDFELVYSTSDIEYIEEDNSWRSPSKSRQVVFWSKNPLLLEYLIQKHWGKLNKQRGCFNYYRWSFFTWDKVNALKSKDIISVSQLDRRAVHDLFETASIEDLMSFKIGEKPADKIQSILNNYHLVRDNSISFMKAPNYWIIAFKDGSKIKVKTNLWERGLHDVTNHKLYYHKNSTHW